MVNIKILSCFGKDYEKSVQKQLKNDGTWNGIKIITDDTEEPDYYVAVNYPYLGEKYLKSKLIIIETEPELIRNCFPPEWRNPSVFYHHTINGNRQVVGWHLNKTYDELVKLHPEKTEVMSAVIPGLQQISGQNNPILKLLDYFDDFDLYQPYPSSFISHERSLEDPDDGLLPYRYTLVSENHTEKNYFSEKLTDAILAECLCFYHGCPNVEDWIDPEAFIRINIEKPEEAVKIIREAIFDGQWKKRIDIIRREKVYILNHLQIFPTLESILKERKTKHLNHVFDKVLCINLERCKTRWDESVEEFNKFGLKVERFEAVDGRTLSPFKMVSEGIIDRECGEMENSAVLGNICSHVSLWKKIVANGWKWTLVLEDDVKFHPDFCNIFDSYWKSVPKNADIVFLGCTSPKIGVRGDEMAILDVEEVNSKILKPKNVVQGSFAYALSLSTVEKLLKEFLPIKNAIDYFPIDKFNIYIFRRPPGTPEDFYIDVETWNGSSLISLVGLVSVRNTKSTICHFGSFQVQKAIFEKERRNYKESFMYLQSAKKSGYLSPTLLDYIGITAYYLGNYSEGVDSYEKLISNNDAAFIEYIKKERQRIIRNLGYYLGKSRKAASLIERLKND